MVTQPEELLVKGDVQIRTHQGFQSKITKTGHWKLEVISPDYLLLTVFNGVRDHKFSLTPRNISPLLKFTEHIYSVNVHEDHGIKRTLVSIKNFARDDLATLKKIHQCFVELQMRKNCAPSASCISSYSDQVVKGQRLAENTLAITSALPPQRKRPPSSSTGASGQENGAVKVTPPTKRQKETLAPDQPPSGLLEGFLQSDDQENAGSVENLTPKKTPNAAKRQPLQERKSEITATTSQRFYGPKKSNWISPTVNLNGPIKEMSNRMRSYPPLRYIGDKENVGDKIAFSGRQREDRSIVAGTRGLANLGNTCYINAILQALYSLEGFGSEVRQFIAALSVQSAMDSLAIAYHRLLENWARSPEQKAELVKRVKHLISAKSERFNGYEQHDAHEFLSQTLDQLKDEFECYKHELSSELSADNVNPVVNNFEFTVQHSLLCEACGNCILRDEVFYDLSLDQPVEQKAAESSGLQYSGATSVPESQSLETLLNRFFQQETISYKCEKCSHGTSILRHHFAKLPRILVLHVKRYYFNATSLTHEKVDAQILIPERLDLASLLNNNSRSRSTPSTVIDDLPLNGDDVNFLPLVPGNSGLSGGQAELSHELSSTAPAASSAEQMSPEPSTMELDQSTATVASRMDVNGPDDLLEELMDGEPLDEATRMAMQESRVFALSEEEQIQMALNLSMKESDKESMADLGPGVNGKVECESPSFDRSPENTTFGLCAVVSHLGVTSDSGHYVTDAFEERRGQWFCFDDRLVQATSLAQIQASRRSSAYIFFYELKK